MIQINNGESGFSVRSKLNAVQALTPLKDLMTIARAAGNKLTLPPWLPVAAWTANDTVITGAWRKSDGHEWACIIGGVTANAPTVAGSAGTLFTDGAVTWERMGAVTYPDPLPNGPTLSLSAVAPALTKFYANAASTWASGATIIIKNDAWFNRLGWTGGLTAAGIGDFGNGRGPIAFWTDAAQIVVAFAGSASTGTYVEIDGRLVTRSMIQDTTVNANTNYLTINLPTTPGPHFVVIWRKTNQNSFVRGIYVAPVASLWADESLATELKFHFVADSQGECELYKGSNWDRTLPNSFAAHMGALNVQTDAGGGTGFSAGGAGNYSAAARLAKITAFQPDVICVWASNNDTSVSQATLTAAINSWHASVRAIVPNAVIFVSGQMNPAAAETNLDSFTRQAIQALMATDNLLFWIPTTGAAEGPWHTGTGKMNAPQNDGNADLYRADDGLHFGQRGKEFFGRRWFEAVRKIVLDFLA